MDRIFGTSLLFVLWYIMKRAASCHSTIQVYNMYKAHKDDTLAHRIIDLQLFNKAEKVSFPHII